jgi:DedD protein
MRLPFFRASKPAIESTGSVPGKAGSAASGSAKDALGLHADGPQQAARTGARRRLMGAAVLLAVGVIGFPILFETKPRPLPVDLPILLAEGVGRKSSPAASAQALPKPPPDAGVESGPVGQVAVVPLGGAVAASAAVTSGRPASAPSPASLGAAPVPAKPASEALAPTRAAPPAVKASAAAPRVADAALPAAAASRPATAAKPQPPAVEAAAGNGRFVVQVGAYNDTDRLRAARQKLEQLGLKSYTQDVETASGKRTRVRVGPFPTRKEADAVAAKVKASGMQANILAL